MNTLKIGIALLVFGCFCWGQDAVLARDSGGTGGMSGFNLSSVSLSTGAAFFNSTAFNSTAFNGNGGAAGGCNCFGLGSASGGYTHMGPISDFAVSYTPTLWNRFGSSGFHSFDQSLRLSYESRFLPRWRFSLTGTADDSSVEQLLFSPSLSSGSSAVPLTPADELAAYVGSTLTPGTPVATLLYGGRVLNVGGRTGLTYRPSSRFRVSLTGGIFESQTRPDRGSRSDSLIAVIPRTRFESVEADLAYSLTPLSEVGLELSSLTYQTVFGQYQSSLAQGSYARKLSPRWSTVFQAGVGVYQPVGGKVAAGAGSQFAGSAGIAYQGGVNSFDGKYQKSAGNLYGLAASSTRGFEVTWKWQQRGRNWSTYVTADRQQLTGSTLSSGATLWQAGAGVLRPVSQRMWMSLGYGYLRNSLAPVNLFNNDVSAQVIRLTLAWTPSVEKRIPAGAPIH